MRRLVPFQRGVGGRLPPAPRLLFGGLLLIAFQSQSFDPTTFFHANQTSAKPLNGDERMVQPREHEGCVQQTTAGRQSSRGTVKMVRTGFGSERLKLRPSAMKRRA